MVLTYANLMTLLGYFLDRWSRIELEISMVVLEAEHEIPDDLAKVAGTLEQRLSRWRAAMKEYPDQARIDVIVDQVLKLRDERNLIVHGCAGGNSAPNDGSDPHIRVVIGGWQRPSGKIRLITASELDHYKEVADACWRAIRHPHALNCTLGKGRKFPAVLHGIAPPSCAPLFAIVDRASYLSPSR